MFTGAIEKYAAKEGTMNVPKLFQALYGQTYKTSPKVNLLADFALFFKSLAKYCKVRNTVVGHLIFKRALLELHAKFGALVGEKPPAIEAGDLAGVVKIGFQKYWMLLEVPQSRRIVQEQARIQAFL